MRILYLHNAHNENEVTLTERIQNEMGSFLELIPVESIDVARDVFNVHNLPALVILRDDLQGEHMLDEEVDGKLHLAAACAKLLQEEIDNLNDGINKRIDHVVKKKVDAAVADNYAVMNDMAAILTESKVI